MCLRYTVAPPHSLCLPVCLSVSLSLPLSSFLLAQDVSESVISFIEERKIWHIANARYKAWTLGLSSAKSSNGLLFRVQKQAPTNMDGGDILQVFTLSNHGGVLPWRSASLQLLMSAKLVPYGDAVPSCSRGRTRRLSGQASQTSSG